MGIAVCEDSEAVSQSLDDFLEGSPMFARPRHGFIGVGDCGLV